MFETFEKIYYTVTLMSETQMTSMIWSFNENMELECKSCSAITMKAIINCAMMRRGIEPVLNVIAKIFVAMVFTSLSQKMHLHAK